MPARRWDGGSRKLPISEGSPLVEPDGGGAFVRVTGPCWRAVAVGRAADPLAGTVRAGRYNPAGDSTLYVSATPEGVAAAMARYGSEPRLLIEVAVDAGNIFDLRDAGACRALGGAAAVSTEDWMAALDRGAMPPSWTVADRARRAGAQGLIYPSRRQPACWHLALFGWRGVVDPRARLRHPPPAS